MEVGHLEPDLVSHFPWGEVPGDSLLHDLLSCFISSDGFFSGFFKGSHAVFQCWNKGLSQERVGLGFISE